jgi:ketol-acid reductoisomerase
MQYRAAMRVYFEADADPALIRARRVAIVGYGNQGRAQALNLRDSKVAVTIGLPGESRSRARAADDGFDVMTAAEAAAGADVVVMLAADEQQGAIYADAVAPNLRAGGALAFAHGLNIRFGLIAPRADLDVFLVAPKGPGTALRSEYEQGRGLISLFAVAQDATGQAEALALSYAAAIGSGRVGMLPTSFAEECEADIFNEAAVLWGAIPELIQAGFETLVDAGFSQEIAYFECLTEVKLIADLIYERGIAGMREAISNTAEFGALEGGRRIVTAETRAEMRRILAEVRSGALVGALVEDAAAGYPRLRESRARARAHAIEAVGDRLRKLAEARPQAAGSSDRT